MKVSITKVRDEWINKPPPGFNVKFDKYPSGKDTTFVYGWEFEILCPKLLKEAGYDLMYYVFLMLLATIMFCLFMELVT